jgi:putative membrane protein
MNYFKKIGYFAIFAATLVLGLIFAEQNTVAVPLNLLVFNLPEHSVALWVLLAFSVGGVTGMLTSMGLVLRLRTTLLRVNRQLAKQAAPKKES